MAKKILVMLVSLLLTLFLFEGIVRFFVQPSEDCYGIFLGKRLLPEKIKKPGDPAAFEKSLYQDLIVNGRRITFGDMCGMTREDSLLRHAPLKGAVSVNGWWQSNALGASRRSEVAKAVPPGKKRAIVFGDSFTQCQGLPMENSWPFYLEEIFKGMEVINFGVGGYNTCQSYLRYKMLSNEVDHNVVMLGLAPSSDLWRDVNVYRGFFGWVPTVMPRFEIEGDHLKLIAGLYKNQEDLFEENQRGLSDKLKAHLRAHDRFYFLNQYEAVPIIRDSVLLKLLAVIHRYIASRLLLEPGSEAVQVTKKIIEEMNKDAHRSGAEFVLVILPDSHDVLKYKKNKGYREKWERMVSAVVGKDVKYIDLMQGFKNVPDGQSDTAYDGAHHGPRANRVIAEWIAGELARMHVA
jgi:hypothetical protein